MENYLLKTLTKRGKLTVDNERWATAHDAMKFISAYAKEKHPFEVWRMNDEGKMSLIVRELF